MGFYRETYGVFGMLRDKGIEGVCRALKDRISAWFAAGLSVPRGADAQMLADALSSVGAAGNARCVSDPLETHAAAPDGANANDINPVLGTFANVADPMQGG